MRLAASMARATRTGAETGAISRPLTSFAFSGGGGGGVNTAPPPLGMTSAWAAGASVATPVRQASAMNPRSSLLREGEGILFRTPAGLADGLALKELARSLRHPRSSPQWPKPPLVPPLRACADSAWRATYQMIRQVTSPL